MQQSEVNQLVSNKLQANSSKGNLSKSMTQIIVKVNKYIYLWLYNLSYFGTAFKTSTRLNIAIILPIIFLSIYSIHKWTETKYPYKIDYVNLIDTSPKLPPNIIKREKQKPYYVDEVVTKNMFRKERNQYIDPPKKQSVPLVSTIPQVPMLPAPELILRGVMILNKTKIAILEGSYPIDSGNKTENKPIKRKGYYLGDRIGNYKISQL